MPLSVNRSGFAPFLPTIIQSGGSGRGDSCFASLFAGQIGFSLVYSLFLRDIPLLFALIVCYSVFAYPFYCLIFYTIAARLMPGRAPLCVLIAGFSRGRVVRYSCPPFHLRARVYNAVFAYYARGGWAWQQLGRSGRRRTKKRSGPVLGALIRGGRKNSRGAAFVPFPCWACSFSFIASCQLNSTAATHSSPIISNAIIPGLPP